ncbi:hypothetical protein [Metabacillus fastidiosus]
MLQEEQSVIEKEQQKEGIQKERSKPFLLLFIADIIPNSIVVVYNEMGS